MPKISNEISTEISNFDITDMLKDEIKDYKREVLKLKDTIKDSDLRWKELVAEHKTYKTKLY